MKHVENDEEILKHKEFFIDFCLCFVLLHLKNGLRMRWIVMMFNQIDYNKWVTKVIKDVNSDKEMRQ